MSHAEQLKEILKMARQQRERLAQGDLVEMGALFRRRQQILDQVQVLDGLTPAERNIIKEILEIDTSLRHLLVSDLELVKKKMKKTASVLKFIGSDRSRKRKTPSRVSFRA